MLRNTVILLIYASTTEAEVEAVKIESPTPQEGSRSKNGRNHQDNRLQEIRN